MQKSVKRKQSKKKAKSARLRRRQQQNRIVCELSERERESEGSERVENFAARHKRSMSTSGRERGNKRKVEKCMQISIAGLGQIPRQVPDACLTE